MVLVPPCSIPLTVPLVLPIARAVNLRARSFGQKVKRLRFGTKRGSAYPAIYTTWLNRVIALGATPPDATKAAVGTFYSALLAAGFTMADFDYMYLMIGENSGDTSTNKYNQKRVNLALPGTFDATVNNANASGHTAVGTQGNGSMYWLTGFNSSTRIVNRGANNNSMGVVTSAVSVGGTVAAMGVNDTHKLLTNNAGSQRFRFGGTDLDTVGIPTFPCLTYGEATPGAATIYRGATQIITAARTNADLPAQDMAVFSQWNGSVAFQITDETLAFAFKGKAFSAPERTSFYTAVQSLMAAFSVTI